MHTAPLSPTSSAFATYVAKTRPLLAALSASLLAPVVALAAESVAAAPAAPAVEKVVLGPPPTDFGLNYKEFYEDCNKVVNHMRYAVQMEKGDPNIAAVAQATKDEMLDYVSYYRRFNGINGKQSFSLLYTSINVLAGHYTSYGSCQPPEPCRSCCPVPHLIASIPLSPFSPQASSTPFPRSVESVFYKSS